MPSKLLAVTGGAGRIGTALRPLLRPDFRLRLIDVRPLPNATIEGEEAVQADVSNLATAERVLAGVDAVLHLAGNPSPASTWDEVRGANVEGTYAVFDAARRQGVRKVVFATTNHVMGMYSLENAFPIGVDQPIRPDSYYAVSKAFGEALARYYAEAFDMSMICIRIGWFVDRPHVRSGLGLWISPRDMAQLVRLSLETPRRFGIYNGTSNNSARQWDLALTRQDLGYAPQDDSAEFADQARDDPSWYVRPQAGALRAEG
jgi:NAD+ dependent glucose-6-phosphate dehydrogenase